MKLKHTIITLNSFTCLLVSNPVSAQFELDTQTPNMDQQPEWGPIGFNYVSAYYLPEYNIYYEITEKNFIIKEGNKWKKYQALPRRYARLDLYTTYKMVLQDGNKEPYQDNKQHKNEAPKNGTASIQIPILDAVKFDDRYK